MIILRRHLRDIATEWRLLPIVLRRLLFVGVMLLGGLDLLVVNYQPVLTCYAYLFRVEEPLVQSDAIVILLGEAYDRSSKAAELYRQGLAPIILMGPAPSYETDRHRNIMMESGVAAEAIQVMPGEVVKNTYDEAMRLRDYVRMHPVRRITVVTTAYHTARTRWIFQKVLQDMGVTVHMVASQDLRFTESDWYTKDVGIRHYVWETLKTFYYRFTY